MNAPSLYGSSGAGIALVGLGNVGSQTAALLAGIESIRRVLLIDPDRYEASNLGRQRIGPADVGRRKVDVQAKSLRRTAPHLQVETFAHPVESMPLGLLRGCVILSCVDSRIARQAINRSAFALGTPWIDAALDRDGQVRSRIYWPGGGDCLECAWGARDYELLEQRVPCALAGASGARPQVMASAAAQELGAVAAGLQVAHLRRVLSGEPALATGLGRQWFLDLATGRGWVGSYTLNPACRLDHRPWSVSDVPRNASGITLSEALRLASGDATDSSLALDGQMFVWRLRCVHCGNSRRTGGRVFGRLRSTACRSCGAAMTASAADVSDVLSLHNVTPKLAAATLSVFGMLDGDIYSVRSQDSTRYFRLSGPGGEVC